MRKTRQILEHGEAEKRRKVAAKDRKKHERLRETNEHMEARLAATAMRTANVRASMTQDQLNSLNAANAARMAAARASMTPEQVDACNAANAARMAAARASMTPEQLDACNASNAARMAAARASMTPEQLDACNASNAARMAAARASMTPEQLDACNASNAAQMAAARASMTPEELHARNASNAARMAAARASMTPEQREASNAADAARMAAAGANMTREQLDARNASNAARMAAARASMTPELRDASNAADAVRMADRRAQGAATDAATMEAVRKGTYYCDIDAHLNYCTETHLPPEQIPTYAESITMRITDKWAAAKEVEAALRAEMFATKVCACCGKRTPARHMCEQGATAEDPRLRLLVSEATIWTPNPLRTRVKRSASSEFSVGPGCAPPLDCCIHESYDGEERVFFCTSCDKDLRSNKLPELCYKTVDLGAWPTGKLREEDEEEAPLPPLTDLERMVVSPVKYGRYLTVASQTKSGHAVPAGHLKGHVTAFMKAPPDDLSKAIHEHYPMSQKELGNRVNLVYVTGETADEAKERAKTVKGMQIDPRKIELWCDNTAKMCRNLHASGSIQVTVSF